MLREGAMGELRALKRGPALELTEEAGGNAWDLIWADPDPRIPPNEEFRRNFGRKTSVLFGQRVARQFLETHGLSRIVRSHQEITTGVATAFEGFDGVVTVFSAMNYGGKRSQAAMLLFEKGSEWESRVFGEAPTQTRPSVVATTQPAPPPSLPGCPAPVLPGDGELRSADLTFIRAAAGNWLAPRQRIRCVVVGHPGAGKSSLIAKLVGMPAPSRQPGSFVGARYGFYRFRDGNSAAITLWDTCEWGERGRNLRQLAYGAAQVFVICFAFGDINGLQSVERWRREIGNRPVLLVRTKADEAQKLWPPEEDMIARIRPHGIVECSAVSGRGLDILPEAIARVCADQAIGNFMRLESVKESPVATHHGGAAVPKMAAKPPVATVAGPNVGGGFVDV